MTYSEAERADLRDHGAWMIGDCSLKVMTETGVEYAISRDGYVAGGTRILPGLYRNKLLGSVHEPRGRILLGVVVPGMRMEIHRMGGDMFVTSRVVGWEEIPDPPPREDRQLPLL